MGSRRHLSISVATATLAAGALLASPGARAQTPPAGYSPAPPASGTQPAPTPGYAPPPYPYPYPYPYAPPRDLEKEYREAARDWEPGDPVPPGYRAVESIRRGLVVGGAVLAGSLWLLNCAVAATLHEEEHTDKLDPLFAPVAGPFIAIGTTRSDSLGTFTLLVDGFAQAGGLAMVIAGVATTQTRLVRDASRPAVLPVPFAPDTRTAGLGLVGTF